jgi:hypothetical protein
LHGAGEAEKLAGKINSNFQKSEYLEMTEDAFARKGVVLISWQREYIPEIANRIPGEKTKATSE